MAAYNAWMNEKLFAVAAELTDEERKRDLGAFFRSVHGTLNHLFVTDEAWLQRVCGEPTTLTDLGEERFASFEELRSARRELDRRIGDWAATVTEAFAPRPLRFRTVSTQREVELPGWVALVQMFNHQTHHRGQVTTLLKQLGKEPGDTDFPMTPGLLSP